MNNIVEKHFYDTIRYVLIEKGYCSLEDFGTFYLFKTPAKIISSTHALIPPRTEARFNPGISRPDPFLLPFFIKLTGLNENEAKACIQQNTGHLRRWLEWKKEVRLPGIGTVVSDEANQFYLLSELVHPDDIGKKNIFLAELKSQSNPVTITLNTVNTPSSTPHSTEKNNNPEENKTNSFNDESTNETRKNRWIPFLRAAALILLVFLLVLFSWFINKREWNRQQIYMASVLTSDNNSIHYQPFEKSIPESKIKKFSYPTPAFLFDENGFATISVRGMDFLVAHSTANKMPANPSVNHSNSPRFKPHGSSNAPQPSGYYYIITGSFSLPENAIKFLKKLKSMGYNATLAGTSPKGLQMVAASSAPTAELAEAELEKIRHDFATAWILKP
jgi:nucleoid DNA-binding protein